MVCFSPSCFNKYVIINVGKDAMRRMQGTEFQYRPPQTNEASGPPHRYPTQLAHTLCASVGHRTVPLSEQRMLVRAHQFRHLFSRFNLCDSTYFPDLMFYRSMLKIVLFTPNSNIPLHSIISNQLMKVSPFLRTLSSGAMTTWQDLTPNNIQK